MNLRPQCRARKCFSVKVGGKRASTLLKEVPGRDAQLGPLRSPESFQQCVRWMEGRMDAWMGGWMDDGWMDATTSWAWLLPSNGTCQPVRTTAGYAAAAEKSPPLSPDPRAPSPKTVAENYPSWLRWVLGYPSSPILRARHLIITCGWTQKAPGTLCFVDLFWEAPTLHHQAHCLCARFSS